MKIFQTFGGHAFLCSLTPDRPRTRGIERGRPAPGACLSHATSAYGLRAGCGMTDMI